MAWLPKRRQRRRQDDPATQPATVSEAEGPLVQADSTTGVSKIVKAANAGLAASVGATGVLAATPALLEIVATPDGGIDLASNKTTVGQQRVALDAILTAKYRQATPGYLDGLTRSKYRESHGSNRSPAIDKLSGGKDKGSAWCSYFSTTMSELIYKLVGGKSPIRGGSRYLHIPDHRLGRVLWGDGETAFSDKGIVSLERWAKGKAFRGDPNRWRSPAKYKAQAGDFVVFEWGHVGIVHSVTDKHLLLFEGNKGDRLQVRKYALDDPILFAIVDMGLMPGDDGYEEGESPTAPQSVKQGGVHGYANAPAAPPSAKEEGVKGYAQAGAAPPQSSAPSNKPEVLAAPSPHTQPNPSPAVAAAGLPRDQVRVEWPEDWQPYSEAVSGYANAGASPPQVVAPVAAPSPTSSAPATVTAELAAMIPQSSKDYFKRYAKKIDALRPVYERAARESNVPVAALIALDLRENGCDPTKSTMEGEALGTPGPVSKKTYHTKYDSLVAAGHHLREMAKYVYGIKVTLGTMDRYDLMGAFLAFNRGKLYQRAGLRPQHSPYVMNGFDGGHLFMHWPDHENEPLRDRGEDGTKIGAMVVYVLEGGPVLPDKR